MAVMLCLSARLSAQNPIRWKASAEMKSAAKGVLSITAAVAPGWHLYGFDLPAGGPKSTSISLDGSTGVKFTSSLKPSVKPVVKMDDMFGVELSWWASDVVFTVPFEITDSATAKVKAVIEFMGCDDRTCLPPKKIVLNVTVGSDKK